MEKTVVELFAGVGGFRCGLNNVSLVNNKTVEDGNWNFVWANQWEPATKSQEAFFCYTKRFGENDASNVDIFKVNKREIPNHTLLVGGFPCQDYSVAQTLANSKGIEGKKGVLWWAINDILKIKKPPFVFLENVDRLLLSPAKQKGRDFGIILRSFFDNGYGVEWRVINAADYGMPQKRRRVYIIAFHKSAKYYKKMKKKDIKDIINKDGIFAKSFKIKDSDSEIVSTDVRKDTYENLIDVNNNFKMEFLNAGVMIDGNIFTTKVESDCNKMYPLKNIREKDDVLEKYFLTDEKIEKFKYLKGSKRIPRVKPNGEAYLYSEGSMPFPDNLDSPARTMLTSESGISRSTHVIEDYKTNKLRFLTPVECERINGFPDDWTNTGMSDKKRYFMMGNALVVEIVKRVGNVLEQIVEEE